MTVSELIAGMNVTCRPCAVNSPWCRATKKPAESTAGTTATFRFGRLTSDVAAFPPPASRGRNKIARTTLASTAPATSAARTARANLRAIDVSFLRGFGPRPVPWSAGRGPGAVHRTGRPAAPSCSPAFLSGRPRSSAGLLGAAAPGQGRAIRRGDPEPVAEKILLQVAAQDIGQLTDLLAAAREPAPARQVGCAGWRCGLGRWAVRGGGAG